VRVRALYLSEFRDFLLAPIGLRRERFALDRVRRIQVRRLGVSGFEGEEVVYVCARALFHIRDQFIAHRGFTFERAKLTCTCAD
jgi:hypothetical protein